MDYHTRLCSAGDRTHGFIMLLYKHIYLSNPTCHLPMVIVPSMVALFYFAFSINTLH